MKYLRIITAILALLAFPAGAVIVTTNTSVPIPTLPGYSYKVLGVGTWGGATVTLQSYVDGAWITLPDSAYTADFEIVKVNGRGREMQAVVTGAGATTLTITLTEVTGGVATGGGGGSFATLTGAAADNASLVSALGFKVDLTALSTNGGANKVLQLDANGNLTTGPTYTGSTQFDNNGNIFIPDLHGLRWTKRDGTPSGYKIFAWEQHDAFGGEFLFESPWRMAFICNGPVQFGNNASARNAQFLHMVSGATTIADPLRNSKAISFQTRTQTPAASPTNAGSFVIAQNYKILTVGDTSFTAIGAASNTVGVRFTATGIGSGTGTANLTTEVTNHIQFQGVALDDTGTNSVFRILRNSDITGNAGGFNATNGNAVGTAIVEAGAEGLWSPGTAPAYTTLTDAATITQTASIYKTVQAAKVTLAGNRTLAISGAVAGMRGVIYVAQDTTGSRTLTLPSNSAKASALALSTTAALIDRLVWEFDGSFFFWTISNGIEIPLDADASAFIDAARANITDAGQRSAVNTLVTTLKASNVDASGTLWSKLLAIYPFVGGNDTAHSKNLKTDTYNITWSGTPTHNSNGVTGNDTDAYGNTGFPMNALGQNSAFIYWYSKTQTITTTGKYFLGGHNGVTSRAGGLANTLALSLDVSLNSTADASAGNGADWRKHFALNRSVSGSYDVLINSAKTTITSASQAPWSSNLFVLARNSGGSPSGYTSANLAFTAFGASLSDAEQTAFRAIVTTFQITLGRANP